MILKYAIALATLILLAAFFTWAFLPARHHDLTGPLPSEGPPPRSPPSAP